MNRRHFLGGTISGFFAYALQNRTASALAKTPMGKAKRCVVLWMNGGPSQLDTFDPKPGTTTGGEFKSIPTAVPGISISETLPSIAKHMDKLSVVRNLTSNEGEHLRGQYFLHTGFPFVPAFPRPAIGSVVSHEATPTSFPQFVTIGSQGFGPAYMGPDHAPFSIENPQQARELLKSIRRRKNRIHFLQDLGESFDVQHATTMLDRRRSMVSRIEAMASTRFVESLDVEQESAKTRARYGDSGFGQSCLVARRLLELGVSFVEVQHNGWDTHANNFNAVRRLCGEIDQPWSALMDDLKQSGMLDDTLIVWMGEFGRTPNINGNNGRDHFPRVTPVVLGGGGIQGGQVVGKTNRNGTAIDGNSNKVANLFATIFSTLGIDPAHEFETAFGSPAKATEDGAVIGDLV